ncbi:uncharacterized protein LOC133895087 [Phragmites australis]|uniref:uncharacterized protein LOC133895087 n=1 Tax=Phragmites australis TaxID=29695 RepID=UPI002D78EEE4|nr:uncharacterized protein LOC133895087 [Phragmites australis]
MDAKTLTPEVAGAYADATGPETLVAGELVWAKPSKSRRHCWWPARLLSACPATTRDACVSYFREPAATGGAPAQVRRFAHPDADGMARGSTARAFLVAVDEAHAHAVAILRSALTCGCVPPPSTETDGAVGVANLPSEEFLAALRDAALGVLPVGLVDRARLKSWVRAFGEGWGPDGAGHYPRRPLEDLVDKIDLDVPAGEDRDADDWFAEDEHTALERPQETPMQKKRSAASLMDKLGAREDEDKNDSTTGPGTSGKRERKKSKYLSPPYTNLGVIVLPRKAVDLPKTLVPSAAEDDSKVLPDSIVVEEVLLLVQGLAKDVHHKSRFPKAAEEFLGLFRSSAFTGVADFESYEVDECPAEHVFGEVGADIAAGMVSDSHAVLKQGKCVSKRSRKKDKDGSGSGSSSIKRKKRDKTSPPATLGRGILITPAIPIRQVKAEDIISQMKAGSDARGMGVGIQDEKAKPLAFKCPVSAAVPGATKLGQEQVQANVGSVVKIPVTAGSTLSDQTAKENNEAKVGARKSETNVQTGIIDVHVRSVPMEALKSESSIRKDESMHSIVADVPISCVSKEATKSEANICLDENMQSAVAVVPDRSVLKEATGLEADILIDENVQSVVADVPVRSGPSPMHGDIAQTIGENKEHASVEVRTVQQSYASLQAMVPEMLQKVEGTNGTDVTAVNCALKYDCQMDEEPDQKVKLTAEAAANHSSGEAANGTCPDPANSTHKKKKKKAAQHFGNPAALVVNFRGGVILPSKEELLSTFGKFGFLIESHSEIVKDTRSARVVFAKSTEAEAAYESAETLGQFGPPFAETLRLDYLPPIKLSSPSPPPASNPEDIRKNLEKMIAFLTQKKAKSSAGLEPVTEKLLGEMQDLLAKVNKMVSGTSTSTPP